jgi:hypothetical protein
MDEKLKLDYEHTISLIRMLTDIRFKLLAFVPTLAGTAVAVLDKDQSGHATTAIGLLGLAFTVAVSLYDLRNSMLYDAAIHRAKGIEADIGFACYSRYVDEGQGGPGKQLLYLPAAGGLYNERATGSDLIKMRRLIGPPGKFDVILSATKHLLSRPGSWLRNKMLRRAQNDKSNLILQDGPLIKHQGETSKKGDPGQQPLAPEQSIQITGTVDPRQQASEQSVQDEWGTRKKPQLTVFYVFPVWHDGALALAYGAAVAGWSYLILNSLLRPEWRGATPIIPLAVQDWVVLVAALLGLVFAIELSRFSRRIAKIHKNKTEEDELIVQIRSGWPNWSEETRKSVRALIRNANTVTPPETAAKAQRSTIALDNDPS